MTIGTVPPSGLPSAQTSLALSMARLSSGLRINSARDDAAGLAIASSMTSLVNSDAVAIRNVYDGISLAQTAEGALGGVSESLGRIRELSLQAANGTNSASDRRAIQAEIDQLSQGIDKIASSTDFNGQKLLDGSFNTQIQTGQNPGDSTSVSIADGSANGLGISGLDVTSPQGAAQALSSIDGAIDRVNESRAGLGAIQGGLGSALANLTGTYENISAARSRILDTDYASESANMASGLVRQEAANMALKLYSQNQASIPAALLSKIFSG